MRKRAEEIIKEQKCDGNCFSKKSICPLIDRCELGRRREIQSTLLGVGMIAGGIVLLFIVVYLLKG